ncbi:MAG TPA: exodeoxyribonuclease VII small subunit [Cyclobacteriaceae bacterium]|nr:exodeoxyribonuclease VII small subunit [Cyclobacteriaceae bacterium]HPW60894.1 exodeoxyribonuclease VII small subunit [Cyclobacteriaceae bacterium]
MNLTYNQAFNELSKLVDQVEDDKIQLDTLADKVKQAKELIDYCEMKLRSIDKDVEAALSDKKPTTRKKK